MTIPLNTIIHGDALEVLKGIPADSFDSCVTDPPYGLGFMGKAWDKSGIANNVDLWREVLRVLKPGAHLLSFGGSRTYHRMACAIEDAGFEIRDQIMWIYGSGFPKSLDISKAIDKAAGEYVPGEVLPSSRQSAASETGIATSFRTKNGTNPQTDLARQWQGWGTALKPAHEPICVARKPFKGTVAENVLAHGTGAININTAPKPVLRALCAEVSAELADKMDEYRRSPGNDLSSVTWYKNVPGMGDITIKPELIEMVKSNYFTIYSTGMTEGMEQSVNGVVQRSPLKVLSWRLE